jgi:hypothetical protein
MTPAEIIQDAAERYAQGYIIDFCDDAKEIRNMVLEEAAKECEKQVGALSEFVNSQQCLSNNRAAADCASAIRAMKGAV